ncbi:hypothetical protein [Aliivibrio salmonicida]|uniref:hypothetical protein n=1 Tax=Aliivibrio salmonicida TaxID=40269 RepID=UPI003D1103FE
MSIQEVDVKRDENGFWTHPDLPYWGEETPISEINLFLEESNLKIQTVWFDGDAPEDIHGRYYEAEDNSAVADWKPTKPDDSFLLSLHDTEDGPVAIFASKVKQC